MGVSLPRFPPLWRESLAGVEAAALFRSSVWRGGGVPDGEGRPVLLIPGFMAGDSSMSTMTRWLRENGYYTHRAHLSIAPYPRQNLPYELIRRSRAVRQEQCICASARSTIPQRVKVLR